MKDMTKLGASAEGRAAHRNSIFYLIASLSRIELSLLAT